MSLVGHRNRMTPTNYDTDDDNDYEDDDDVMVTIMMTTMMTMNNINQERANPCAL